ncbi:MAG: hypothetical protein ACOCQD_01810 [archaeon]
MSNIRMVFLVLLIFFLLIPITHADNTTISDLVNSTNDTNMTGSGALDNLDEEIGQIDWGDKVTGFFNLIFTISKGGYGFVKGTLISFDVSQQMAVVISSFASLFIFGLVLSSILSGASSMAKTAFKYSMVVIGAIFIFLLVYTVFF